MKQKLFARMPQKLRGYLLLAAGALVLLLFAFSFTVGIAGKRSAVAKATACRTMLDQYVAASLAFHERSNRWPVSAEELHATGERLPRVDGWGRAIEYVPFNPSAGQGLVISYGRDQKPGGVGLDADIGASFGALRESLGQHR